MAFLEGGKAIQAITSGLKTAGQHIRDLQGPVAEILGARSFGGALVGLGYGSASRGGRTGYEFALSNITQFMIGGSAGKPLRSLSGLGRFAARTAMVHGAIGLGYGAISGQGMLRHGVRGVTSPVRWPANAILGTDY